VRVFVHVGARALGMDLCVFVCVRVRACASVYVHVHACCVGRWWFPFNGENIFC